MPRRWTAFLPLLTLLVPIAVRADEPKAQPKPAPGPYAKVVAPFVAKYCVECHGATKPKADLNLTAFGDEASVVRARKLWVRLKEYVESGEMPPEKHPKQPAQEEIDRITGWVDATLERVNCQTQQDPGRVTMRRLNRAEYNNTIRDLVGIDFKPAEDFPSDDVGYGFDNIGDVLTLPPILFEKYLDAAELIAERAIVVPGKPAPAPIKTWEADQLFCDAPGQLSPDGPRVLASVGSIGTTHTFPASGRYVIRARAFGQQAGPEPARMIFQVDGKLLHTVDVPAVEASPEVYEWTTRIEAGEHKVAVHFPNDYYDEKAKDSSQRDRNLVVDTLEVQGPLAEAGLPLPPSHRLILFKTPKGNDREEVAHEIVERFATRAYRRPLQPGEVAKLLKFVDMAKENGEPFERGIQLAVEAVLVSPQFLFRVEVGPKGVQKRKDFVRPPNPAPVTEYELASRLSYFLWSSMPDDELFGLARDAKLRDGDTLEKQVRRMLRDPKSSALVENFALQWLQLRNLKTVNPDRGRFPTFDDALRASMLRETELFFGAILTEDRSVADFLDADYTFVNERLARHYGISGVQGEKFRKVSLKSDGARGGLLTQASVLTVTSNPTRTSPVKRGKWILEQFLGTPPPPPPPDVPELKDDRDGPLKGSLRQRMERHRANPACASCHARMDPLGFGFENFDAVGAWRDKDAGFTVDPSGVLPNGQKFQGPKELKAILRAKDRDFTRTLAEKLMTYATGRGVEYYDTCAVDRVVEATASDGFKFSRLVLEVAKSDPFQKRKKEGGR